MDKPVKPTRNKIKDGTSCAQPSFAIYITHDDGYILRVFDSFYALSFKIYVTVFMLFNATAWNAIKYASVTWSQSIRSVARLDLQMFLSALRLNYWDGQMMFIYFRPMPKW